MTESTAYKFEMPKHHRSIIKVMGVGGGGSNAVNHMYEYGIQGVEFVVANTDVQALNSSPVPCKVQLGTALTEGLGCGSDPDKGRASAEENKDQIRELLVSTKMVFITAGMGGGTGTGAAPVIAKIAKDMDILTVGIVTIPFRFEGDMKLRQAMLGVEAMRSSCDTVLVVVNDKILETLGGKTPLTHAFIEADNVLTTAAKGIAEIITCTGYMNVDFQDVRTVMRNAGVAVMGSSEMAGEERALLAAQQALASPLLDDHDIMGARRILLSITSGKEQEITSGELAQITEYIQEQAGHGADMKFGHSIDPLLGDRLKVTVIAAGFDSKAKEVKPENAVKAVGELGKPGPMPPLDTTGSTASQQGIELKVMPPPQQEIKLTPPPKAEKPAEKESPVYTFHFEPSKEPPLDKPDLEKEREEEQVIGDEVMGGITTKSRLEEQRRERSERLKSGRVSEMTKEELDQKSNLPAYVRRNVHLEDTPPSNEGHISRYNLSDDNSIVKNNKFFHDNVD